MATSAQIEELKQKVAALVEKKFNNNLKEALVHYVNSKGNFSKKELISFLTDADVGNWLTRGTWAKGIMEELDTNNDGEITPEEFQRVLPK